MKDCHLMHAITLLYHYFYINTGVNEQFLKKRSTNVYIQNYLDIFLPIYLFTFIARHSKMSAITYFIAARHYHLPQT